jgi:hypothetical protein
MEVGNPKDAIYIGLDVGIYYTDNTMNNTWMPFMKDLPNSSVRDLEINEKSNLIRAGTFGRGIWESATYSIATGITTASGSQEISIYPNPNPGIFTVKLNGVNSNEEVGIEVFNQLGEKVYAKQGKLDNNELQVNISSLTGGAYILNFKAKDAEWHAKILKE